MENDYSPLPYLPPYMEKRPERFRAPDDKGESPDLIHCRVNW